MKDSHRKSKKKCLRKAPGVRRVSKNTLGLNPTLFWDAREVDTSTHAAYIISRVLDFGNERDVKRLRRLYSDRLIIDVIMKRRGLMPMTGNYWAIYFNIPFKKVPCLRRF